MVWTTAAVSVDAVATTESVLEAAFWINAVSAAEADEDVVSTGTTGVAEAEEVVVSTETTATGVEDTTATAVDDEATVGSAED